MMFQSLEKAISWIKLNIYCSVFLIVISILGLIVSAGSRIKRTDMIILFLVTLFVFVLARSLFVKYRELCQKTKQSLNNRNMEETLRQQAAITKFIAICFIVSVSWQFIHLCRFISELKKVGLF